MAVLREVHGGGLCVLDSEQLIGRSPQCGLHLNRSYVSSQHACVRWTGDAWELKDLGSRNGTFVDRRPVEPGRAERLARGNVLAFGGACELWELVDDSPPGVTVLSCDGELVLRPEAEVLAIPESDHPIATLFRAPQGVWRLEEADGSTRDLEPGALFEVGGRRYRFCSPTPVFATSAPETPELDELLELEFRVAPDEEHVELQAVRGHTVVRLGARAHNYLLLLLARARLNDARTGLPESSCGWIYQDELLRGLQATPAQLNIDVFRIRKHFARAGLGSSVSIIERRSTTRQLRIGVARLTVRST